MDMRNATYMLILSCGSEYGQRRANSTQDVLATEISVGTPECYNKTMSHGALYQQYY